MFEITIFIFIWSLVIKLEANSWFKFLLVRSGKITGILEDVAEAGVLEKDRSALNKSLHNVSVKSKNEKKKKIFNKFYWSSWSYCSSLRHSQNWTKCRYVICFNSIRLWNAAHHRERARKVGADDEKLKDKKDNLIDWPGAWPIQSRSLKWVCTPPTKHHPAQTSDRSKGRLVLRDVTRRCMSSHVVVQCSCTTSDGTNGFLAEFYAISWCSSFLYNKNHFRP